MKTVKIILLSTLSLFLAFALSNCGGNDEGSGNSMDITVVDPQSPATLKFNDFVVITYNYSIASAEGARMWIQPYTDGSKTPGYLYSSSKVYTGNGTRQVGVSVDAEGDPVKVDQLRVVMTDPDQNNTYLEYFVDVDFTFEE